MHAPVVHVSGSIAAVLYSGTTPGLYSMDVKRYAYSIVAIRIEVNSPKR